MQFGQVWDDRDPDHAPIRLEDAVAEIARHDADIVHLQEVEHAQAGGAQVQPPPNYGRIRAALPGYHGHFGYPPADPRELPFGIGLAILSKTPLRDTFAETLPSPPIEFDFFGEKKTPTDRLLIGATAGSGRAIHFGNSVPGLLTCLARGQQQRGVHQRGAVEEHVGFGGAVEFCHEAGETKEDYDVEDSWD